MPKELEMMLKLLQLLRKILTLRKLKIPMAGGMEILSTVKKLDGTMYPAW